jgi:hypothetical protein
MSNARNLAKLKPSSTGLIGVEDLESSLDLTGKTVTLPAGVGGKVVGLYQRQVKTALTYNTTAGNTILMGAFDFDITPVSRANYFLYDISLSVSMTTQGNAGFIFYENSSGSYNYIRDTSGNIIYNTDYASVGPSKWQYVLLWYGFAAGAGNNEEQRTIRGQFLTRLESTSGSSQFTFRIYAAMGETPPLYINRQTSINTGADWCGPSISTVTVMEIAA